MTLAAELERHWAEQWRRSKSICEVLEHLARAACRPELRLVSPHALEAENDDRPALKPVDA